MCGLCGALGGAQYWIDAAGDTEFQKNGLSITRRKERERRLTFINHLISTHGLKVLDLGGNSFVLEGEKGKLANIYNIAGIWSAVDENTGADLIDPLDKQWINIIEGK